MFACSLAVHLSASLPYRSCTVQLLTVATTWSQAAAAAAAATAQGMQPWSTGLHSCSVLSRWMTQSCWTLRPASPRTSSSLSLEIFAWSLEAPTTGELCEKLLLTLSSSATQWLVWLCMLVLHPSLGLHFLGSGMRSGMRSGMCVIIAYVQSQQSTAGAKVWNQLYIC